VTAVELEPGVHQLTDEEYFAPGLASATLSASGAKVLLKPGGPARFHHQRQTGAVEIKREFDLGHAVHTLVLGAGPEPVPYVGTGADPEAWRSNADKAAVAAIRAVGKVPLKQSDFETATAMAVAVRTHRLAGKMFVHGEPEQALIWRDSATGVMCRLKTDWLRATGMVDLKTTEDAAPDSLSRSAYNYGYYVQDAFYRRGFRALFPGVEPWFALVAVEKSPPHLVHVHQLSARALAYGDRKVSEALEIYRDCAASGVWPGYPDDEITEIDLPAYVRTEEW
jgi:hypothetical protein